MLVVRHRQEDMIVGSNGSNVLDDTGRLWGLSSLPDRPRSDFAGSTGEVTDQLYVIMHADQYP